MHVVKFVIFYWRTPFPNTFKLKGQVQPRRRQPSTNSARFSFYGTQSTINHFYKAAERCGGFRNSPKTQTSATRHTPHSYTLQSSCSSSSLHPCWTDFPFLCASLWASLAFPPTLGASLTSAATDHSASKVSERKKECVCLCG